MPSYPGIRHAKMLFCPVLDSSHTFNGPLVVNVDVLAHAGVCQRRLLFGVVVVVVCLVFEGRVVR